MANTLVSHLRKVKAAVSSVEPLGKLPIASEEQEQSTPMRRLLAAFKDVPAHKIKVWPLRK